MKRETVKNGKRIDDIGEREANNSEEKGKKYKERDQIASFLGTPYDTLNAD